MVTACKCVEKLCTVLYRISCDIDRHIDGLSGVSCVLFHPILSYSFPFHSIRTIYVNTVTEFSVFPWFLYPNFTPKFCTLPYTVRTLSQWFKCQIVVKCDEISIHLDLAQLNLSLKTLYRSGIDYPITAGASVRPTQQLQQHIRHACVDFLNPKSIH